MIKKIFKAMVLTILILFSAQSSSQIFIDVVKFCQVVDGKEKKAGVMIVKFDIETIRFISIDCYITSGENGVDHDKKIERILQNFDKKDGKLIIILKGDVEISDTLDLNEYIVRTYGRFTKVDDRQKPFIKKYLNEHEIVYNQINPGKTLRGISVEEKKNLLSPSKDFKIKLYYDKFSTGERFGLEDIFKKEEKESKYSLHSNFLGYIGELATEYMMIGHKYTSSFPCREKYNSNNVIDVNAPGFDGVFSDGDSIFLTESRSRLRSQRVSEMFKEVFYDRWAEIKDKNKLDKMPKIKLGECGIFDNIDKFNMEDTVLSFVKKFKDKPDKLFMLASRFNKYGYGEVYVRSLAELPNDKREKIMKLLGDDSQMLTKIDDQTPNTGSKKENIDNSGMLVFPVSRGVSLEDRIKAMNLTEFSDIPDVDRALKVLMKNGVEIFTNKETNVNGQQFFLDLTALPLKNTFSSFLGFN